MNKKSEYAAKFKDPRWQKKRLEILNRDEFTCQLCGDTETTLNIHHKDYLKGKEPWDYPNEYLTTVCEPCHQILSEIIPQRTQDIIAQIKLKFPFAINILAFAFEDIVMVHNQDVVACAIAMLFKDGQRMEKLVNEYFEHIKPLHSPKAFKEITKRV